MYLTHPGSNPDEIPFFFVPAEKNQHASKAGSISTGLSLANFGMVCRSGLDAR